MKKYAYNPILPLDKYIPDGERTFLTAGDICSGATTEKAAILFVSLTMNSFPRR